MRSLGFRARSIRILFVPIFFLTIIPLNTPRAFASPDVWLLAQQSFAQLDYTGSLQYASTIVAKQPTH